MYFDNWNLWTKNLENKTDYMIFCLEFVEEI